MNLNDILNMEENPNDIKGIYDYCDNWCERCPFTSRCASFRRQQLLYPDDEIPEIEDDEFRNDLEGSLLASLELLQQVAEKEGFEPLSEEEYAPKLAAQDAAMDEIFAHYCYLAAETYRTMTDEWLGDPEALESKIDELNDFIRLKVAPEQAEIQMNKIGNAAEVIRRYQLLIQMQIMEALQARQGESKYPGSDSTSPDGKAKVAHIAIDRSIKAWGDFLHLFPDYETSLLEILAQLARIRRMVEKEFPQARSFIRPGFDTHALPS